MSETPPETVLQFGTGKFLRCFADLFVHELNEQDRGAGRVVVLQSTGAERAHRINERGGRYRVAVRGLENGRLVDRTVQVTSISRALAAEEDWAQVLDLARSPDLTTIVSNTTEAGYRLEDEPLPGAAVAQPRSFPAKLLAALQARFEAGGAGLTILPCELLEQNADRLRTLAIEQASRWRLSAELIAWIESECAWCNTLVDRIVSAPSPGDPLAAEDPLFAVAEPFALWLVEGTATVPLIEHPAVHCVERLSPYLVRKVRILNGAHTALVAKALPRGVATVREAVADPHLGPWLRRLLFEEIVPTLEGRVPEPERFAHDALERFANPFLDHRLADIALHQEAKLQTRLAPTRREYVERFGRRPALLDEIMELRT